MTAEMWQNIGLFYDSWAATLGFGRRSVEVDSEMETVELKVSLNASGEDILWRHCTPLVTLQDSVVSTSLLGQELALTLRKDLKKLGMRLKD